MKSSCQDCVFFCIFVLLMGKFAQFTLHFPVLRQFSVIFECYAVKNHAVFSGFEKPENLGDRYFSRLGGGQEGGSFKKGDKTPFRTMD